MNRLIIMLLVPFACSCGSDISFEDSAYEGRPHFLVRTKTLTYYYDIRGGGFSRILDQEGNDWVSFKVEPWGIYPASAASAFRGLPNLVFQQADDGAGHPGHDKCTSRIEGNRIITKTLSGLWEWNWEFHDSHAILEIIKTDLERSYWFLYEGTPGGSYSPGKIYFGNNTGGPYQAAHDYYKGKVLWGNFQWIYAGNTSGTGTFYMVQEKKDEQTDMISFLGNTDSGMESPDGMTVFGFGRGKNATPLLKGSQRFMIGIYPECIRDAEGHEKLRKFIIDRNH